MKNKCQFFQQIEDPKLCLFTPIKQLSRLKEKAKK